MMRTMHYADFALLVMPGKHLRCTGKKQNVQYCFQNDTQCNLEIYTQIDVEEVALYKYCKNLAVALFASMQIVGSGTQQAAQ